MPKERKEHSSHSSRSSPYPSNKQKISPSSSSPIQNTLESPITPQEINQWEDATCPVCMDHPHNAVQLLCSCNEKGCRPFMCDTSYRHSNCLDQYFKWNNTDKSSYNNNELESSKIPCPLCRGTVSGWTVVGPARAYMNSKSRSCSSESCNFVGNYGELRKHAREVHPDARPSEADPDRQRDWQRLERERDLGDLFSVLGESELGEGFGGGGGGGSYFAFPPFAIFLIVQVLGGGEGNSRNSRNSRVSSRSQRQRRRVLWGESISESGNESNGDESNGEVSNSRRRSTRARRRQLRMQSDDENEW